VRSKHTLPEVTVPEESTTSAVMDDSAEPGSDNTQRSTSATIPPTSNKRSRTDPDNSPENTDWKARRDLKRIQNNHLLSPDAPERPGRTFNNFKDASSNRHRTPIVTEKRIENGDETEIVSKSEERRCHLRNRTECAFVGDEFRGSGSHFAFYESSMHL
jgi:hypothetical protein